MHELVFMLQFRLVLLLFANILTFLLHLFNYVCIGIVRHVYAHTGMPEPCLFFTLSSFVCVHDHMHV